MAIAPAERFELLVERRLLRDVVALVRRCELSPPPRVLDAVLAGTSAVRPLLPAQRERWSA